MLNVLRSNYIAHRILLLFLLGRGLLPLLLTLLTPIRWSQSYPRDPLTWR